MKRFCIGVCLLTLAACAAFAEPARTDFGSFAELQMPGLIHSAIGVTRRGTEIRCILTAEDLDLHTPKTRILLIGGMDGKQESVHEVVRAVRGFYQRAADDRWRKRFVVSAVPCINPDGIAAGRGPENLSGGNPDSAFPPQVEFYGDQRNPESAYLWRWIKMHAPDVVVDVQTGPQLRWFAPPASDKPAKRLHEALNAPALPAPDSLVAQLQDQCGALKVEAAGDGASLQALLVALQDSKFSVPSSRRRELQKRVDRSPHEIANQLAQVYGRRLPGINYIHALAIKTRMRLGPAQYLEDAKRLAQPYLDGEKRAKLDSPAAMAGHLLFAELAMATKGEERRAYANLARKAADLAFDEQGNVDLDRLSRSQMSDAVFMAGPILSAMSLHEVDQGYRDACVAHLGNMRKLLRRDDGLYRHWPGVETAWGRGNGFVALGLMMCRGDLFLFENPDVDEYYGEIMEALAKHQDPTGLWHQVIDQPGSYRELTCSCMIATSMLRGVRLGWLPKDRFQPIVDRAWYGVKQRIAPDGSLFDVCTGTGKQKDLRAYYDRRAILGRDDRGGAMALLFAYEKMLEVKDNRDQERQTILEREESYGLAGN